MILLCRDRANACLGNYAGEYSKVKQPGSMATVEMTKDNGVTGL